jgi:hypothetical protein
LFFPRVNCADLFEKKEKDAQVSDSSRGGAGVGSLSPDQLAAVIERMGQLVLGVKNLFDSKCNEKTSRVSAADVPGEHSTSPVQCMLNPSNFSIIYICMFSFPYTCACNLNLNLNLKWLIIIYYFFRACVAGMLLDLCMGSTAFSQARAQLAQVEVLETVDFPLFLQLYAPLAGLTHASLSNKAATRGLQMHWVPSNDGLWIEVHDTSSSVVVVVVVVVVAAAATFLFELWPPHTPC